MLADILHKVAGFEKEGREKYYPRPSLAGPERCIRQMVYWAQDVPSDKTIADRFIHVLNDSSWHEELTADWIRKSAYQIHSQQMEITCYNDGNFKLTGHIDGIITDMLGNDYHFEHKAINHFTFERYANGVALPLDYINQCCLYLNGLQAINDRIDTSILLIKNKNTSAFLEFRIHYEHKTDTATIEDMAFSGLSKVEFKPIRIESIITTAIDKFKTVEKHRLAKTLPDRQYTLEDWQCKYCQWERTCWEGYDKEFEALTDEAILGNEAADMCRYYLEINGHMKDMDAEKNEIKEKIKKMLADKKAKGASAGEYIIKNVLQERDKLNKEFIPPDILASATEKTYTEILYIKKRKVKSE